MTRNAYSWLAALIIAVSLLPFRQVCAQDGAPMGSVTVAGRADSLFARFRTELASGDYRIERVDSVRRTIRFVSPHSKDEAVVVRFESRGDSTLIAAQGVKGGMLATMTGLMAVHAMISPKDSTPPTRPPSAPHGTLIVP
jgi:hypothetical protein